MGRTRDALVGAAVTLGIVSGYAFATRPQGSRAATLRDLYSSPLCLGVAGNPRAGSPTVAAAWARTIAVPLARAKPDFVGTATIELRYQVAGQPRHLSFIVAGPHRWRFNEDPQTADWVAHVCAPGGP